MNATTLPRGLVLKLLHKAQLGDGAGFIVLRPDGGFRILDITADADTVELRRTLGARGETAFAFYRSAAQTGPDTEDLRQWGGLTSLFLSVSVGTKGVLQLRGWQVRGGKPDPLELSLAEEDAVQNSGVSR